VNLAGDVDLVDPARYRDGFPHDTFTALRAAGAVHRHPPASIHPGEAPISFWSVVRHSEVVRVNRDWESFTATDNVMIPPRPVHRRGNILVAMDPPDHTRLRRLVSSGFTPRMIERLEERIGERTRQVLDTVGAAGECDFVREVAWQVPMHVIADIVGIPEPDRAWVFARADVVLPALSHDAGLAPEALWHAIGELFEYTRELTDRKRAEPEDDVWTHIAQAEVVDDDGTVTRIEGLELESFFLILAIAGSETTRNALSQGLLALVGEPAQLAALRAEPAAGATAADEIIRWSSPVMFFARTATRRVELDGQVIEPGERVVLWFPSANRDERVFADPFGFDVRRTPNPHVSFGGGGPHYCLGANLARKEVEVVTSTLFDRFDVELAGEPVWRCPGPVHNVGVSVERLPIRLVPRR
jgi:cytochrome P450